MGLPFQALVEGRCLGRCRGHSLCGQAGDPLQAWPSGVWLITFLQTLVWKVISLRACGEEGSPSSPGLHGRLGQVRGQGAEFSSVALGHSKPLPHGMGTWVLSRAWHPGQGVVLCIFSELGC